MASYRPDYEVGTVTVAADGTTVTGAGGMLFTSIDLQPGDDFGSQGYTRSRIVSIDSDTQLTIEPWRGPTLVDAPYFIRWQADGSRYAAMLGQVRTLLGQDNIPAFNGLVGAEDLLPMFTGPGTMTTVSRFDLISGVQTDAKVQTLAERAIYDASPKDFSVLVANVGSSRSAIYFKLSATAGDWSVPAYLTGADGVVQSQGQYNNATAYVIGQIVLDNGSSWIARINTTGNPPPLLPATSNTQWFLLASAGNGFVFRGDYAGATAYKKDDVVLYNNSSWIALGPTTGNTPPALPTTSNTYWSLIAAKGSGDVSGPATSTDGNIALFNGVTGKVIKEAAPNSALLNTALPDRLKESAVLVVNLNTITASGWYRTDPGATGQPASAYAIVEHRQLLGNAVQNWFSVQASTPGVLSDAARYTRVYDGGAWGPWVNTSTTKISGNYLSGYLKRADGTIRVWGQMSADATAVFATVMPNTVLSHGASFIDAQGSDTEASSIQASAVVSNGITWRSRFIVAGTVGVATQTYKWWAEGY